MNDDNKKTYLLYDEEKNTLTDLGALLVYCQGLMIINTAINVIIKMLDKE